MGILGFIATTICCGATIKNDFDKERLTRESKTRSIKNKWTTYSDYRKNHIKERAVSTNEPTTFQINNGHKQIVGLKTGRIYFDNEQNVLDGQNAKLKRDGKKFFYKEFPQYTHNGMPKKLKVEIDTGKAYCIGYCGKINGKEMWHKIYYNTSTDFFPSTSGQEEIFLNEEEAYPWYYSKHCKFEA